MYLFKEMKALNQRDESEYTCRSENFREIEIVWDDDGSAGTTVTDLSEIAEVGTQRW